MKVVGSKKRIDIVRDEGIDTDWEVWIMVYVYSKLAKKRGTFRDYGSRKDT